MKIAINGIGVAGPTLAYWLRRYGHEPVLFERAPALRDGGYVIDFWGVGYQIAERMGLVSTLTERGYRIQRMRLVDGDGREVAGMDVEPMRARVGGRFVSIPRADLAAALFRACDGVPAHFGVWITGVTTTDRSAIVTLSNGREEAFDLVIGADGLHSSVREAAFGPEGRFETRLGCHVAAARLRGYPRRDELAYVSYTEPKRQVGRVALRDDETLVLLIGRSELFGGDPGRHEPKAALRRAFGDMTWEVPAILDAIDSTDELYFDRVSQIHLPRWSAGRVALIGDAVACPSFLAGEGTGLAMLEAYVLAGELHRAGGHHVRAFDAFERRLRGFVEAKQRSATWLRGFFAPRTRLGLGVRNLAVRSMAIPLLSRYMVARTLHDDLELPTYDAIGAPPAKPAAPPDLHAS